MRFDEASASASASDPTFRSLCRHQESEDEAGEAQQLSTAPPKNASAIAAATAANRGGDFLRSIVRIWVDMIPFDWSQPYNRQTSANGSGSGAVIDADDSYFYILTAFHVVDSASRVHCSFATLGRAIYDADLLGACPEVDVALLRVSKQLLPTAGTSSVSILPLGNSDKVQSGDIIRAVGFPLGENSVWSTNGVIAGRLAETGQFQTDVAINRGNSGGPAIDKNDCLIGVVVSKHSRGSQMGYVAPLAQFKSRLPEMRASVVHNALSAAGKNGLVHIPSHNAVLGTSTRALLDSLGAPRSLSGAYVRYVFPESALHRAGVRSGDVLSRLGCALDNYGQVETQFWNDRLHVDALMRRAPLPIELQIDWWSSVEQRIRSAVVLLDKPLLFGLAERYPPRQPVDYETFGGVVVMPLNIAHMRSNHRFRERYAHVAQEPKLFAHPPLVVTHVMPGSSLSGKALIEPIDCIASVNGSPVKSLQEYRQALLRGAENGERFVSWTTNDGQKTALLYIDAVRETLQFAKELGFTVSDTTVAVQALVQ